MFTLCISGIKSVELFQAVDAVVFMIDSTDLKRLGEAKKELLLVLNDEDLRRRRVPIVIMGNKIDLEAKSYCMLSSHNSASQVF